MQDPTDQTQDLSDEERCRRLVQRWYSTPEGRTILDCLFGEGPAVAAEVMTEAMVSLVRRGEFGPDDFISPEAHRAFCERYGIEP